MAGRRRTAADDSGKEGSAEKTRAGSESGERAYFYVKDAQYSNG